MRRRLGIEYNYTPTHLHSPEDCRYLSPNECQERDLLHSQRHLNVAQGTDLRVLVLLIKFSNHVNLEVPPRDYFEELFNGEGTSEINPVGSVKEWLRYNSLGKYRVHFDVREWEVTDNTEAHYAGGTSGWGQPLDQIFAPILTKFDLAGSVDWFNGYVDESGYFNHLVVLHSGFVGETGDRPCVPEKGMDRIWSNGAFTGGPDSW
jgi:M6 family metalloprotease-like protein